MCNIICEFNKVNSRAETFVRLPIRATIPAARYQSTLCLHVELLLLSERTSQHGQSSFPPRPQGTGLAAFEPNAPQNRECRLKSFGKLR